MIYSHGEEGRQYPSADPFKFRARGALPGTDRQVDKIELLRINQGALSYARSHPGDLLDVPWLAVQKLAQLVAGVALPKVTLPSVEFHVLQLKEVPSVANPTNTDYQALVTLRMKTLALHSAGRAKGNQMIRIGSPLSLPVAASLGAQPAQKLEYPVWLVQDFEAATGIVLADAGSSEDLLNGASPQPIDQHFVIGRR
jgi:hypothetical protein